MPKNTITPKFRVSFPNVFKPKKNGLSGKEEYSIVALFPKGTDLAPLKAAAQAAIEGKWGKEKSKWPANLRSPFRDQAERAKIDEATGKKVLPDGHEEGAFFMNLKSSERPGVVDQRKQPIIDESEFYAGCFARASIRAYAYDQKGNRGVSFALVNIQKMGEGDPLSGRTKPEHDFEAIEVEGSADDIF